MARTKTAPTPAQAPPAPAQAAQVPAPAAAPAPPAPLPKPALPAVPVFVPKGLEDVSREDIIIPRIQITQPMSKHGKAGHYYDVVADENVAKLEGVVPLKWRKGRVFFEKPEDKEPRCASDDRRRPADRIETPIRPECAGCPMSLWTDEAGKRKHPKCQETYTLLMVWKGGPYFVTFKSSAIAAVKRLLTQLTLQASRLRKDVFAFTFDMALEERAFEVGKAFLPKFENLRQVTDAEAATYASIFDTYATVAPTFDPPAESPTPYDGEPEAAGAAPAAKAGSFDFAK